MLVKIRFLGILSARFGNAAIVVDIKPNYKSLHDRIEEMLADKNTMQYVVYRNGRPLNEGTSSIEDDDEFSVFLVISGG